MRTLHHNGTNYFEDWHQTPLKKSIFKIVEQLEGRVFLDDDLCRDPAWLDLSFDINRDMFYAIRLLRHWPGPIRFLGLWLLPICWRVRAQIQKAEQLLQPLITKREAAKGFFVKTPDNTIDWIIEAQGGASDLAAVQLGMSIVALEGAAELTSNIIADLSAHPQLVKDLRAEIIQVIGQKGVNEQSLRQLILMDSVMKETQRIHPLGLGKFKLEDLCLPNFKSPFDQKLITFIIISYHEAEGHTESRSARWFDYTKGDTNHGFYYAHDGFLILD